VDGSDRDVSHPRMLKTSYKRHSTLHKTGFTLIEILIAIALIVIIGLIAVPILRPSAKANERSLFITRLNGLLRTAVLIGEKNHTLQRVVVDLDKKIVRLESESLTKNEQGESVFEPTKGLSSRRELAWPRFLTVQNFYIEGFDEMENVRGKSQGALWFFITPEGLAQDVIINMIDTKDTHKGKPATVGLVLNPFCVQFEEYDTFQK
jgi:prepilin-type N-terminal cleavage/methylation domain-containing protein